ncbi:hypothetical protein [Micromonospora mirobrigensis]|uniref:Tetratricopeptide repeat-containing protein n=1 Tax=Micromonospora mirobrigensis TaxID=262898 RepID=A0A1C4TZ91_9ACTN|nr:hypothetical protein [Micromonospora mirobrigensis]SCE64716.1 hypothetical protein GA0070564_10188 [Micromonospora mirobrigensis]
MTAAADRELLKTAYEAWEASDWALAAESLEALLRRHPDRPGAQAVHVAAPPAEVAALMDAWVAEAPSGRSWTGPVPA